MYGVEVDVEVAGEQPVDVGKGVQPNSQEDDEDLEEDLGPGPAALPNVLPGYTGHPQWGLLGGSEAVRWLWLRGFGGAAVAILGNRRVSSGGA